MGDNILEMANGQFDAFLSVNEQLDTFLTGTSQMVFAIRIVAIVIGLLVAFFGLKLIRVLSALSGLAVGAGVGAAAAFGFHFSGTMIPVTILVCAVVLAVLSAGIRKFGAFLVVFLYTAGIVVSFRIPQLIILLIVCALASILMAVLSLIFTDPIVIVVTGISGGLSAGIPAAVMLGINDNLWIGYVIGAVIALLGIWTQFMVQSRKIGKKEKVYSKQMREQVSRESEVEKARRILEEDDEEDEADSRAVKSKKKVKSDKKKKIGAKSSGKSGSSNDAEEEDDDIVIIDDEL